MQKSKDSADLVCIKGYFFSPGIFLVWSWSFDKQFHLHLNYVQNDLIQRFRAEVAS